MTVDQEARLCYMLGAVSAPTWEQLGEVTKSVWREYVVDGRGLAWSLTARGVPAECLDLWL
jgi:hypothetical protein